MYRVGASRNVVGRYGLYPEAIVIDSCSMWRQQSPSEAVQHPPSTIHDWPRIHRRTLHFLFLEQAKRTQPHDGCSPSKVNYHVTIPDAVCGFVNSSSSNPDQIRPNHMPDGEHYSITPHLFGTVLGSMERLFLARTS